MYAYRSKFKYVSMGFVAYYVLKANRNLRDSWELRVLIDRRISRCMSEINILLWEVSPITVVRTLWVVPPPISVQGGDAQLRGRKLQNGRSAADLL